ncbi:hypothetical protein N7456_013072 [Penicillium angulare]|uniref:Cytochrome P450 n=1 Tax=Penicillium angulare TaxID=116970 RepID=A0A9W9EL09_9EURO|nr:hypothetical protein N7456_013072 [Penicillium angulare]
MPEERHWLWGHGLKLLREPQGDPSKEWLTKVKHDGLVRYLTFFNRERLIVYSPRALSDIYVANCYAFHKPSFLTNPMRVILGNGLLVSEGDDHKFQKKGLLSAFTRQRVDALYPVFCQRASETIQEMRMAMKQNEGVLDIANWASRYALDVIGSAGLGKDFGAIKDENNSLVKVYKKVFKVSKQQRIIFLLNTFLPWWLLSNLPLSHNRELSQASKAIRQVCQDVIHQRRAQYAHEGVWGSDLLSTAIQSGRFSDDNLIDQVMTFLAAGHETTESSLVWAIYLLAKHPELQQKLRAEIRENIPAIDSGTEVTNADLKRIPLLHAVCNETLRIFSPVRLTMREAACDTYLQDTAVPCGTKVMISSCATNIDETLWGPDASEFNPYRWLRKNEEGNWEFLHEGGAMSKYAMLTFSQGHRSCIGQRFARAEFACLIAGWIGRFSFQLEDEALMDVSKLKIGNGITAKPANGMRMRVGIVL